MTKMTYANALEIAIATVENAEVKEKLTSLKAQIAKKNTSEKKPTATQKENATLKVAIVNGLEKGKAYTISEIIKAVPEVGELSNQRVSAIVRQMVESGTLVREEVKRKAYFTLAE